jgi:hypothetical protein
MKIQKILTKVTQAEVDEGQEWYAEASMYARLLAEKYTVDYYKVCGILAALSPLKEWGLNKRMADQYLATGYTGHTSRQLLKCKWVMQSTLPEQVDNYLYGLKTVNFYHNILNPKDKEWVTIDRHIITALGDFETITPKRYNLIKQDIINVANENGFIPCELQAIIWLYEKNRKK